MITIHKLMADVLRLPQTAVTDATTMEKTPEWDSLKHIEVVVAIEQAYGIELTGDEIAEMTSVAAIQSILKRRGI